MEPNRKSCEYEQQIWLLSLGYKSQLRSINCPFPSESFFRWMQFQESLATTRFRETHDWNISNISVKNAFLQPSKFFLNEKRPDYNLINHSKWTNCWWHCKGKKIAPKSEIVGKKFSWTQTQKVVGWFSNFKVCFRTLLISCTLWSPFEMVSSTSLLSERERERERELTIPSWNSGHFIPRMPSVVIFLFLNFRKMALFRYPTGIRLKERIFESKTH